MGKADRELVKPKTTCEGQWWFLVGETPTLPHVSGVPTLLT